MWRKYNHGYNPVSSRAAKATSFMLTSLLSARLSALSGRLTLAALIAPAFMLIASLFVLPIPAAYAQQANQQAEQQEAAKPEPITLQELLDRVKEGRTRDNAENKQREETFRRSRDRQQTLLNNTNAAIAREEARSERLEQVRDDNQARLRELDGLLQERLGVFGELFGIVRQVAGEMRGQLEASIISGETPGREVILNVLAQTKGLPEMEQLEELWFIMQQEMTAQGEIKIFEGRVIDHEGEAEAATITRVGPFTALSDDREFLRYGGEGVFVSLARQPSSRFIGSADDLLDADPGELTAGVLDPSRGALLDLYLQTPSLSERIQQGGFVGYVIIALGLFGVAIAAERIYVLTRTSRTITAQLTTGNLAGDSPLGRVWEAYQKNRDVDMETLELKLDDAILREMPALERGLGTIKLIASVAPLLGLLGTVTGMILTFQAITLFGTGDPKLMAGGISQALMTTVLGLTVAIPTLMLHAIAAARSGEVVQILEEQATGLIAAHTEKKSG